MNRRIFFPPLLVGALAVFLASTPAPAQPPGPRTSSKTWDGGTGVARATAVIGSVSRRHGEKGDLVALDSGAPLVGGDAVSTGPNSRVELRLDPSNYLRLDSGSEVHLRQLGEHAFQIDVIHGQVSYTMMKYGEADLDLRMPNANLVPKKSGVYRVEVRGAADSVVTVRKGEAEVLTPNRSFDVKSGRTMVVRDYEHGARKEIASAPRKDAFDEWSQRRDQILERNRSVYGPGGWYPSRVHVGLGWGWGPYWDPWWGPWWGPYGGFYPSVGVIYSRPIIAHRGGRR
jgi:hypothetical protein